MPKLSIPFVGFLRMQLWDVNIGSSTVSIVPDSQFPLWDFFECNQQYNLLRSQGRSFFSQFPLWDFFECNAEVIVQHVRQCNILSIPFVGFLRMQQPNCVHGRHYKAFLSSQFPLWDFFECNS